MCLVANLVPPSRSVSDRIPSHNIDSCARVSDTAPLVACGHTIRPRSRRLRNRHIPSPSCQINLIKSPLRPRKMKACPDRGRLSRALCTRPLKLAKPRRMSVTHATSQICVLAGIIREGSQELRKQSRHRWRLRGRSGHGQGSQCSSNGPAPHSRSAPALLLMARRCPQRPEVAVRFATALCIRPCTTARHGKASASRTPGSRSRHVAGHAMPPTSSTKASLPRSAASLLPSSIAAGQKRLQQLQHHHPSKPLRGHMAATSRT